MNVARAKEYFEESARQTGLLQNTCVPADGWKMFKKFAREKVKCADDTLEVFIGAHPKIADGKTVARFTRRFEINDEEKYYSHLESAFLIFAAPKEFQSLEPNFSLSTVGFRTFEEFFRAVEDSSAFKEITKLKKSNWTAEWHSSK